MIDQMSPHDESAGNTDALMAELYEELRRLAHARMARLPAGNTLQPTALVHEVWIRLSKSKEANWNSQAHFFGAAAQAMRQILIDQARRKSRIRHGGELKRADADEVDLPIEVPVDDLLALDEALTRLQAQDERKAKIVMLRYFAGLEREEVAEVLETSVRTVDRDWKLAVAILRRDMDADRE